MHYSTFNPHSSTRLDGFDRVLVDEANSAFFEGREFRSFVELVIPVGSTAAVQATVTTNIILKGVALDLDVGAVKLTTKAGGTPSGSFSTSIPVFRANNMTPGPLNRADYPGLYVSGSSLSTGGAHTGGVTLDVLSLKTSGNSNQSTTVGGVADDIRGVGPGTYYFVLQNLDNAQVSCILRLRWEEIMQI